MKTAPFTDDEVNSANRYQSSGRWHPFTCGNNSQHEPLVAVQNGWVCKDCDYTQDWAHEFMLNGEWEKLMQRPPG